MSARLGLLVPSSNTIAEPDFYGELAGSATVHTGRMFLRATTVEAEEEMLDDFTIPAAELVATTRPDLVVFSCTTAGALRGDAYDTELCSRISEVTGAPTVSTIKAVREQLTNLGRTVAVITPYAVELNERIRASLEDDGLDVLSITGLGLTHNPDIAAVSPEHIVEFAHQSLGDRLEADALFVSCTNFQGVAARRLLQDRYGVPVITSNQAAIEAAGEVLRSLSASAGLAS